jgi:hypothetical protein
MDEEDEKHFELKERYVWKWHPHGWLTAIVILIIIFVLYAIAK